MKQGSAFETSVLLLKNLNFRRWDARLPILDLLA